MIYAKLHLIYLHVLYVYHKICFSSELYHIGTSGSITIFFSCKVCWKGTKKFFCFQVKMATMVIPQTKLPAW